MYGRDWQIVRNVGENHARSISSHKRFDCGAFRRVTAEYAVAIKGPEVTYLADRDFGGLRLREIVRRIVFGVDKVAQQPVDLWRFEAGESNVKALFRKERGQVTELMGKRRTVPSSVFGDFIIKQHVRPFAGFA